jgi:sigma-E factor negative regulatory protein RseA
MDRISTFMDGEASQMEAHQAVLRLKQDDECLETWKTFHLIGDTMRGVPVRRDDFSTRFHACMEQEPTLLAPRMSWQKPATLAFSAAASLAAVTAVLMLVFTDNALQPQAQIAAVPKSAATQIVMLPQPVPAANQARVNEYLMAHQEYSPSTTLQGVAPYVRTVSVIHEQSVR